MRARSIRRAAAGMLLAALIASGCSGSNSDQPAAAPEPAPVVPTSEPEPTPTEPIPATKPTPVEVAPVQVLGDPLPPLPVEGDDPAVDTAVPGLAGTAIDGTPWQFTPGETPTAIIFLAHWCPRCQQEVAELTGWLAEGNQLPQGVDIISVSTLVDSSRDNHPPSAWLAEEGWPFPVLADDGDSSVATAYGLSGTPFWVFVKDDGTLGVRGSGTLPPDSLVTVLEALLAQSTG